MQKPKDSDRQRFASVWDAIEDTPGEAASKSDDGGTPTTEVTLWLDEDVVAKFKASGAGWQTRINDALKSWAQSHV